MKLKQILCLLFAVLLLLSTAGCGFLYAEHRASEWNSYEFETAEESIAPQTPTTGPSETAAPKTEPAATEQILPEDGIYDDKDNVALYIHLYGHLPSNYITKREAEALHWHGGSLEPYAPGKCIGGDWFGNYERLLPVAPDRTYSECDIDTMYANSRGVKRIIFSSDGLIYYTGDHYKTFELLYGGE